MLLSRQRSIISRLKLHPGVIAVLATIAVALMIGCGGTAFEIVPDQNVVLGDNVRVLPQDGSALITAIGNDGFQVASRPLSNLKEGDIIAVCSPVLDEARLSVGHVGGYKQLSNKMKLVPVSMVPTRFRVRGSTYSHYLIFNGRVKKKTQMDLSGKMQDGSVKYASSTGSGSRGFIHGIVNSVGHAASEAVHAVTNAATDIASDVTNVVSDVTSDLSSAEQAVVSAVDGADTWVLTQIDAVGEDFAKLYKKAKAEIKNAVSDALQDIKTIGNWLSGTLEGKVDVNGKATFDFGEVEIENEEHNATIKIDGSLTLGAGFSCTIDISDFKLKEFDTTFTLTGGCDITISGEGNFKSEEYAHLSLKPIVVPLGEVPMVIVPVIEVSVDGKIGSSTAGIKIDTLASGTLGFKTKNASSINGVDNGTASGSATWTGSTDDLAEFSIIPVYPTMTFNIDDVAGPYFYIFFPELTMTIGTTEDELEGKVQFGIGFNLDPLGYSGWAASTKFDSETIFKTKIPISTAKSMRF